MTRRLCWAAACVAVGAGVGLLSYLGFLAWVGPLIPNVQTVTAACGGGGAPPPASAPAFATPARCQEYLADLALVYRPAALMSAITAVIAAFVLLVLRFRVRPLGHAVGAHRDQGAT